MPAVDHEKEKSGGLFEVRGEQSGESAAFLGEIMTVHTATGETRMRLQGVELEHYDADSSRVEEEASTTLGTVPENPDALVDRIVTRVLDHDIELISLGL